MFSRLSRGVRLLLLVILFAEGRRCPAAGAPDYALPADHVPTKAVKREAPDAGFPAVLLGEADGVKVYAVRPHFKAYPKDLAKVVSGPPARVELSRGEYEPFQVVVRSPRELKAVTVVLEGLPEGLSAECQPVGVVNIKKSKVRAGWTPDPLHNEPRFDVAAGQNQSFWMTLRAARSAKPGDYALKGKVLAGSNVRLTFACPVRVWDFPMPKLPHMAYICEYRPFNDDGHYKGLWDWPLERQARLFRTYYRWYERNRMEAGVLFPIFRAGPNAKGEWAIVDRDGFVRYQREFLKEFPGVFQVMWQRWMVGYGTVYPDLASKAGQEKFENLKHTMELFVKVAREEKLPLERYIWYAGDEPISPHYNSRQEPIASLNAYVKALRPYVGGMPVFSSAWPFDRDLLASVDIWSMRAPTSHLARMPIEEGMNFGKCVALTLDNSYNLCTDRQAINYRLDPWQAWYAGVPMMENWSNMYWQMKPWKPEADWFSPKFLVPGDGCLVYPPPSEDQVVSSIRAELVREGMEDYEYLWLLRHASYVIRAAAMGPEESDLLRRINECLWDARQWVLDGAGGTADQYIGLCWNIEANRVFSQADHLDALRDRMGQTLQEAYRKGFIKEAAVDRGHRLPREWYRYDNP